MSAAVRRYSLRKNDRKFLLDKVSTKLGLHLELMFGSKPQVEVIETKGRIYVVDGRPLIAETNGDMFPTLLFEEFVSRLPKVVVDMGAVPYICNKADIMGPGIVEIQGEFGPKSLVTVVDVKNRRPLAVAESLYDSEKAATSKRGKLFRNLHCVGDEIWAVAKESEEKRKG